MLLAVTPSAEETEKLRRTYAKLHCFVRCATYKNLVHAAEKYTPDVILLKVYELTDLLVAKIRKIREILPDIALITLSDTDTSALTPDLTYSLRAKANTLRFQALYFSSPSPYASAFTGSLIISGLLLVPFYKKVFLCGHALDLSPEEVFLVRYLAEIHPRRADVDELGHACFTYGKRTPRSTVASRVSRINKAAKRKIFLPIITYRRGEGYGIEF